MRICEQLNQAPDPTKMPLDSSAFPEEVQVAFFMLNYLPDMWEGMSGIYMGKNFTGVSDLFKIYEIDNPKVILSFMKLYDNLLIDYRMKEYKKAEEKAEREAKRASGGGTQYTHNIKG